MNQGKNLQKGEEMSISNEDEQVLKLDQEEEENITSKTEKNKEKDINILKNKIMLSKCENLNDIKEYIKKIEEFFKIFNFMNYKKEITELLAILNQEYIITEELLILLNIYYIRFMNYYNKLIITCQSSYETYQGLKNISELISRNIDFNKKLFENLSSFKIKYEVLTPAEDNIIIEFKDINVIILDNKNLYPSNEIVNKLYNDDKQIKILYNNETTICLYYLHIFTIMYGLLKKYYEYNNSVESQILIEIDKKIDTNYEKILKQILNLNKLKKQEKDVLFPLNIEKKKNVKKPKEDVKKSSTLKKINKEKLDNILLTARKSDAIANQPEINLNEYDDDDINFN